MSDNKKPLVAYAVGARARAGIIRDPALVEQTAAALNEAKALSAIDRATLTPAATERVAVAMLTGQVQAWLDRQLDAAPKNLDPATRAKIARLLTADGGEQA